MNWWLAVAIGVGAVVVQIAVRWAFNALNRRVAGRKTHQECERCGIGLRRGFAVYATLDNNTELDEVAPSGGTGMAAYFCRAHRPASAVPWRP